MKFPCCLLSLILEVNPCIAFMLLRVLYRSILSPDVCRRGLCCAC